MNSSNTILATLLAGACVSPLIAGDDWNREIRSVAMLETEPGSGKYDLHVVWTASVGMTSTPADLTTEILAFVNTPEVPFAALTVEVAADPGSGFCGGAPCGGGCGTGYVDGVNAAALLCLDCECKFPSITTVVPEVPAAPGDEIMVLLRPAAGAWPDPDPSDDIHMIDFNGDPIYWNRSIGLVLATPSPGQPDSFFDIWVGPEVAANADGALELGAMVELLINGEPAGTSPVPSLDLDLVWTQCANVACNDTVACVMDPAGPYYGTCQEPDDGPLACSCLYHPEPDIVFPNVLLAPGDIVEVILVPVPGALPELPGFPDDDEGEVPLPNPCPADINADGLVDVQDLVELFLNWGCTNPPGPCPGDVNQDDVVDVLDLVEMLLAWGACFPV
jgi:hypothetical protein